MKTTLPLFLLCSAIIAAAAPESIKTRDAGPVASKRLVGEWSRGFVGYQVTIWFNKDFSYSAVWTGCLGTYGTARGTWQIQRRAVTLTPIEETGTMRKHLRKFDIEPTDDGLVLVPPDNWCFKPVKIK